MTHRYMYAFDELAFLIRSSQIHMRLWRGKKLLVELMCTNMHKRTTIFGCLQSIILTRTLFIFHPNGLQEVFLSEIHFTTLAFAVILHENLWLHKSDKCRNVDAYSAIILIWWYLLLLMYCIFYTTIHPNHGNILSVSFIFAVIQALVCGLNFLLFNGIFHPDQNVWLCVLWCHLVRVCVLCSFPVCCVNFALFLQSNTMNLTWKFCGRHLWFSLFCHTNLVFRVL